MNRTELFLELDRIYHNSNIIFKHCLLQDQINNSLSCEDGHQSGTRRQCLERSLSTKPEYLSDEEIQWMQSSLNKMKKLLSNHRKDRIRKENSQPSNN